MEVGQGIGRKEGEEGVWAKQSKILGESLTHHYDGGWGGGISGVMGDWGEGGKSRWAAKRGMEALEFLLAGPSHNRWWMGTQQQLAAAATAASRACLNFRVRWGRVSMMV